MSRESSIMDGAARIAAERQRQLALGHDADEDDDDNRAGELALAAVCYAAPGCLYAMDEDERPGAVRFADPWPWGEELDDRRCARGRPTRLERIRTLEKAGALVAAEIDRLLRKRTKYP